MATAIDTRKDDFSEMDNAGISKEHWKIMFISGMGFLLTPMTCSSSASAWLSSNPSGTSAKSKKALSNQPLY
jgi:hypothetical protein